MHVSGSASALTVRVDERQLQRAVKGLELQGFEGVAVILEGFAAALGVEPVLPQHGRLFEVDPALVGQRVTLCYDPARPEVSVEVIHNNPIIRVSPTA